MKNALLVLEDFLFLVPRPQTMLSQPGSYRGVLPFMGRYVWPQMVCFFSANWVINEVSILAILAINWVCFLHSSLELGIIF